MKKPQELAYKKTGTNPTFLSVSLPDWIKPNDYIFAFGTGLKCYGAQKVEHNPQFLAAWGADQFDEGFAFREPIFIGLWKAETNTFHKLEGTCRDMNGNKVEPVWMSLNLLKFDVEEISTQIVPQVNESLIKAELTIDHLPESMDIYKDENVFFKVNSNNVDDIKLEVIQGAGELQKVDRWVNGHSVNYQYTASEIDEVVLFKATGTNIYTDEILTKWQSIAVTNSKPEPVEPDPVEEIEIYKTDQFRLFVKQFKSFGNFIFVQSLLEQPVWLSLIFETTSGGRKSSTLRSNANDGRGLCVDDIATVEVFRMWIDGKRTNVERKKIIL